MAIKWLRVCSTQIRSTKLNSRSCGAPDHPAKSGQSPAPRWKSENKQTDK